MIGSGFNLCNEIEINGAPLPTTYWGTIQLHATIPAGLLSTPQNLTVTVTNHVGAITNTSAAIYFAVLAVSTPPSNPVPSVTQVIPSSVRAGSLDLTVTISGSGFTQSSLVMVNGSQVTTTLSDSNTLSAVLPANLFSTSKILSVTVLNPHPGGGTSNIGTIAVLPPLPSFTAIMPASGAPGTSFVSRIMGNNLLGVSQLAISGAGVTAAVLPGGTSSLLLL